jgi:hypothetical protein
MSKAAASPMRRCSRQLAVELGCDAGAFALAFARLSGEATSQHIAASRELLQRAGGQGFPTFVLTQADGPASRVDIGPWLGRAGRLESAARDLRHAAAARERNAGVRTRRLRDLGFLYLAHWKLAACEASPLT